ncbi:MAG: PepSY domain-containing protein [Acidobacteria bacterium]|nr:PepSY domain-containing protein [Acidobacteriota bacterium]
MKTFRTILFWIHLSAGLVAGIVILIMSVTGVALTYQRQMQWWADTRHYEFAPPNGADRRPATELVEAVRTWDPSGTPTAVTLRASPEAPAAVALGNRTIYVNPYTAQVYGEGTGSTLRAFFTQMVVWHRYLAMSGESRPTGRAMTGAANLLFLFLVLSGVYLWWPKALSRAQLRNILWFRGGLRPKARDFNWHNVLGFWSAIPLALVVYSGVVISYPWAGNMVYQAFGETPPAGRGAASAGIAEAREDGAAVVDVDTLLRRAMSQEPEWTILTARIPTADASTTTVTVDRGDGGQPQLRATLTLDSATGDVRGWEPFSTQTPGRRARSFLRFAHTGEYFGLTGQTIAGLVSAAAVVLVYTGVALSIRRLREWQGRRRVEVRTRAAA